MATMPKINGPVLNLIEPEHIVFEVRVHNALLRLFTQREAEIALRGLSLEEKDAVIVASILGDRGVILDLGCKALLLRRFPEEFARSARRAILALHGWGAFLAEAEMATFAEWAEAEEIAAVTSLCALNQMDDAKEVTSAVLDRLMAESQDV